MDLSVNSSLHASKAKKIDATKQGAGAAHVDKSKQTGSEPELKAKDVQAAPEAPPEAEDVFVKTEDQVDQPSSKEKSKPHPSRLRNKFLSVASTGLAAATAVTSIPQGVKLGLDTHAGRSDEVKRLNQARLSTLTTVLTGSGIGLGVLGPVGMVVGGVVGYITGTVTNHLEHQSGAGDRRMERISDAVKDSVGESKSLWGKFKAAFKGGVEGARQSYKDRKITGKLQLEGLLEGVKEAKKDYRESSLDDLKPDSDPGDHGPLTQLAMRAGGVLFGGAGVMINAPGGMVIGILESLKETKSLIPNQMTKNVMLWATNVGKFLPAAMVSAIGGPVAMAASTLVGVATASVTSIIDGRVGVNSRIARPVQAAVKDASGEDGGKETLYDYKTAGKGAVVGLAAGVREGWKAGYKGGVEMVGDGLAAMPESIEKDDKETAKEPAKESKDEASIAKSVARHEAAAAKNAEKEAKSAKESKGSKETPKSKSKEKKSDKAGDAEASSTTEKSKSKKVPHSKLRKKLVSATSTVMAALGALGAVPQGMQMGLDTKAGKSEDVKRLNAARISTLTNVATAGGVGLAILGPVGMVVGGVVGYVTGTIENHLQARTGAGDRKMAAVTEAVQESVGESKSVWGTAKALFTGGVEAAKQNFKDRKITSKLQVDGVLDGIKEAKEDIKEAMAEDKAEAATKKSKKGADHSLLARIAMRAGGAVLGAAGVMINAPGGLVIGVLESLKETQNEVPSQMTKNIMLWSTNVGKFLGPAIIGAAIGGPVGMAASTAVGVATASVTSIIDGRRGVNRRIASPVEDAVKDAHGEQGVKENFYDYYRAGKGAVVGLAAGVREGWKAGYEGGIEMMSDAFATIPETIEKEDEPEASSPSETKAKE